jgi:hypothetical protein
MIPVHHLRQVALAFNAMLWLIILRVTGVI